MQGGVLGAAGVGLGGAFIIPKTFYFIGVTPLLNFIFKVEGIKINYDPTSRQVAARSFPPACAPAAMWLPALPALTHANPRWLR